MNVTQLVKLIHSDEHLRDVETSVLFLQYTTVVHECPKVSSWHILHSEVDELDVLESVQ